MIKWQPVAAALAAFLWVQATQGATIRVPEDQPTVKAGIQAATFRDTVLVRCGTYYEDSIEMRAGVVLRGEVADPGCVVLQGHGFAGILLCYEGGPDTRIEGLTLRGGGSGLICSSASPTVSDCAFSNNSGTASLPGHGAYLFNSSSTFTRCVFAPAQEALTASTCPAIQLRDCVFQGQRDYAQLLNLSTVMSMTMTNCLFIQNQTGIFAWDCGPLELTQCTLTNGLYLQNSTATLRRSIIAFDTSPLQGAVMCVGASSATIECCDFYGNGNGDWVGCIAGQHGVHGNLSADPQFCGPSDYELSTASPCAPDHAPTGCGLIGALPVACGSQAVTASTWGRVKAMWR